MTVRVEGLRQAQQELRDAIGGVRIETEKMVALILQGISANTMPYVPVDTAALINSERRHTFRTAEGVSGFIEYGGTGLGDVNPKTGTPVQEYARFVDEGPQKNWQKPGASNLFLQKGTRDFIRDDLSRILGAFQK